MGFNPLSLASLTSAKNAILAAIGALPAPATPAALSASEAAILAAIAAIPTPSAGGPWITSPTQFGRMGANGVVTGAGIKTAAATFSTFDVANTIQTYFPFQGATAALAANDTFVTVCDITGAGVCSGMVNAAKDTAGATTSTIEVTRDGVVTTFVATLAGGSASIRQILGLFVAHSTTAANGTGVNSGTDTFINLASTAPAANDHAMVWPQEARALGLAALRFETGLKVRMKIGTLGSANQNRHVGVLYHLDA